MSVPGSSWSPARTEPSGSRHDKTHESHREGTAGQGQIDDARPQGGNHDRPLSVWRIRRSGGFGTPEPCGLQTFQGLLHAIEEAVGEGAFGSVIDGDSARQGKHAAPFDTVEAGQGVGQTGEPGAVARQSRVPKPDPAGLDLERFPERDAFRESERG